MSISATPSPPKRSPLAAPPRPGRAFLDRAFRVWALGATFFGLAMLLVFFGTLTRDVVRWFRVMPQLVAASNQEVERRAEQAGDRAAQVDRRMAQIDREMEDELRGAAEDEKAAIRADYEKIKTRERADLELTLQEFAGTEGRVRANTSPPALVAHFFTAPPSNEPQEAGIKTALLGSLLVVAIAITCAVPLGLGAAVYLEEYRRSSRLAHLIQVNINNLAGVPSVMYGILGAFVFVELVFKRLENEAVAARNALGGGLTLALLTLPLIIVAAQEAIRAVPPSLRHAALALGATRWQTVWRVVLPAALPGTLTGIILAVSRALGEAAPLVLFGAQLYVNQNPTLFSRFTVMPMQIFNWSGRPQEAWLYNAGLASAVLVGTLLTLNGVAIYLRHRSQRHVTW